MIINNRVYFLARKGDTFTQYPLDYTKDIFRPLLDRAESSAKIAIHHRGNLFYFLYYFSLDSTSDIFGMCFMADCLFDDYAVLFNVFDSILSEFLNQGIVLHYSERGERSFSDIELHSFKNELDKCSLLLVASAETSLVESDYLPVDDFSYSKHDVKEMCLSDGPSLINKELGKYSTVILTRTSGGLERNDRVAALLRRQSDRINELELQLSQINKSEDKEVERGNNTGGGKHMVRTCLSMLVFAALVFLYINERSSRSKYECELGRTSDSVEVLKKQSDSVVSLSQKVQSEYDVYKSKVSESYPMIITKIEIGNQCDDGKMYDDFGEKIYGSNTMYLKPRITYYGLKSSTSIRLNVKLFDSDGVMHTGKTSPEGYSYADDISIYFGRNSCVLSGWGNKNKGHYKAGSYRIEIWYKDVCLKSFRFTIY